VDVAADLDVTSVGSNRYPQGQVIRLPALAAHREVAQTSCPGVPAGLLPALRTRIVAEQGSVLLDPQAEPEGVRAVEGRSLDGAVEFRTRLRPAGAWRLEVRDPGGAVVHQAQGDGDQAASTWTPSGSARGIYRWTFAADGRRPAEGDVELRAPVVSDIGIPGSAVVRDDGGLSSALSLRATLWADADWTVRVSDPDGREVFSDSGTGDRIATEWDGAGAGTGLYRWAIAADDVEPVTGELRLIRDAVLRVGATGDVVADTVELSAVAFPDDGSAGRAVIARADVFADAMAGGPLAGAEGPVLLTGSGALDDRVAEELVRVLAPGAVISVLGGEQALAPQVEEELAERWEVRRIAGPDRTATAAEVARAVVARTDVTTALVARADGGFAPWADALAGGAYGADRGVPVLLTDSARLSPAAAEVLQDLDITETVVLGGIQAVSEDVQRDLPGARRVAGEDRAGTAAAIARVLWGVDEAEDGDRLLLAGAYAEDAWTLPLAATPLAARAGAPLYVTEADRLPAATADALRSLGYRQDRRASGWVLGGDGRVAPAVAEEVSALLG
jgi:hypothetical protein